ncbi:MAG: DNA polymerase I [Zoogloeaceae bacterium]|jgi:DNA polymerase-1|nr:DNA polymerase I [Zoogloeaceae bacterium]
MSLLLLVDGSSYLYRAFHALPDLRNRAGFPTGAMKGVLAMLRRLDDDFKAEKKAVVFDAKGKTFRHDWYPAYKAQRPPMPEDLAMQIEPIHAAIRALGWPLISVEGVEADDVIGTLARMAGEADMETLVSTGDKDLAQLVNDRTRLINTMSNELLDVAGVVAKFGVLPERMVDYLALMGDTVDNVPGVAKCGPKTAAKWIAEYGSLAQLVAHADDIKGAAGENLRAHLDFLPLGQRLVRIDDHLAGLPAPESLAPNPPDTAALRELYTRFEFRGWLQALEDGMTGKPEMHALIDDGRHRAAYETVTDEAALERWLTHIHAAPLTAVDTETTSLEPLYARIVGISLAVAAGEACYIPLAHQGAEAGTQLPLDATLARLKPWLESAARPKVGQNIKYDQHVFANHGITLKGIAHDTMLQSYVLESKRGHDMDQLARRHLGIVTIPYVDLCGKGVRQIGFEQVAVDQAAAYAAEDADITLRLHGRLFPQISAQAGLRHIYADIEIPASDVLFRMERTGVLIDAALLSAQSHALGQKILACEQEAYALAGQPFNLSSPQQLAEILFTRQALPVRKRTPNGVPSTNEEALSELALDYPLPKVLLAHRSLVKLKGTYADKLPRMINPVTGRVHTHFAQATAITGRLASSNPNLQNIPVRTEEGRRIRAAFIAPSGSRIVSADYSQIELRIMAHLSADARLSTAFTQGEDVHRATAAEIFGIDVASVNADQRRVAKTINFGLIYGMSAFGLARNLGLERRAAQNYIERYFTRYPGVACYMEATRERARAQGYVETIFGRRLILPEIASNNVVHRQSAERAAINAPMQGTAADIIKLAMLSVQNWLETERLQSRILLQVHDELVLEVPQGELASVREALPRLMGAVAQLTVPLLVAVGEGDNWDAAH